MKQKESRIDVNNSPKRQKNQTSDLDDRISALPDSILGVILSSLPTKNVVSTAFLSKRWKFVWLTVCSLDFYHEGCSKKLAEGEDMNFVRFVNRVLHLHDVVLLNKFRLVWNPWHISSSHVSSWISTAITRNVCELSLCIETPNVPFDLPELFEMPISVFCCGSLQSLELNRGIYVSTSIVVCLPRLETLILVSVAFQSEEAFETLINGCPILNYLHLHTTIDSIKKYFGKYDDFRYRISSTSLTRLELCFKHDQEIHNDTLHCSLNLEASSLEYLKLSGFISDIFVKKNLSSLVDADFRIELLRDDFYDEYICHSIIEVVRAFDYAKALTLSDDVVQALSCGRISLSTEFKRLVKLETSIECCWSSLQDLIQNSHCLEVLTIHQNPNHFTLESDHDHSNWMDPIEVPRCLLTSLKKVVIDDYYGCVDERDMIRYLLKHGSALEVMKITCDRYRFDAKFQLLQEVCKFSRKSPACELEFSEWNDLCTTNI